VISPRGSLTTRRVTAYRGVLAAAALTTLVAATVAAALAVFAMQALPLAARHDLAAAPGTALAVSGPASRDQVTIDGTQLRQLIGAALPGVPLRFYQGAWSDPLGLVPGALPARPPSAGESNTPILEAAAVPGIASRAVLVAGSWPGGGTRPTPSAPSAPSTPSTPSGETEYPVPVALPAASAALLHLSVGDRLRLKDRVTGATATFRVSGLFAPSTQAGPSDDFWKVNTIPAAGYETLGGFATYGPLIVDPAVFGLSATGSGLSGAGSASGTSNAALPVNQGSWVAQPDLDKLQPGDYGAISARLGALRESLTTSSTLGGMALTTTLPDVLSGTASEQTVARSLLVISALQLLLLTVAALLATARLLVSQRESETALLIARGATRGQLARLTAGEVVPLVVAASVAGGLAGTWLAGTLARSGPLRAASLRLPGLLQGSTGADAAVAAVAVAVCAVAALLAPTLTQAAGSARPGAAIIRRGRQATVAGATRAGADLALVLLAVAAGWELRRYSALSDIAAGTAAGGSAGIDPVLALAPALALAGGTVIMLRLLPFAARLTDRLAARGRTLTPALAGWQFSRQPLRAGGAALLIVMAVATGTLALAQHESWTRSAADQSAFAAGASARVDLAAPLTAGQAGALGGQPGAMAVSVQPAASPEVLALGADRAASAALLRGDEAGAPEALFGKITPARTPGTVLPGEPAAIRLTATLTAPALLTSGRVPPEITLTGPAQPSVILTILDATGTSYQLAAGTLPADGHPRRLSARLGGGHASYPLRLIAIGITYPMPASRPGHATLTLAGPSLRGWSTTLSSADLANAQNGGGTFAAAAAPALTRWQATGSGGTGSGATGSTGDGGATLAFDTGFGRATAPGAGPTQSPQPLDGLIALTAAPARLAAIPGLATQAFLDSAPARVGSTVTATLEGVPVPVRIVGAVRAFPTIPAQGGSASTGGAAGGALIVDLSTAGEFLAVAGAQPLPVTQWWLPAPPGRVPAGAVITTAATLRARLIGEPLAAAPQQALLALAAAAALLAITGFCVSIATGVRARRPENALLAALGVTTRSAAAQLCLEKLLLSVMSAALGLVLGAIVARLLVPAVTLTGGATRPVPPPLTILDLPQSVTLAVAVAVLPVLVAAVAMIRRPDPAAELRAGQA
jgi:hypothetical protein